MCPLVVGCRDAAWQRDNDQRFRGPGERLRNRPSAPEAYDEDRQVKTLAMSMPTRCTIVLYTCAGSRILLYYMLEIAKTRRKGEMNKTRDQPGRVRPFPLTFSDE